MPVSIPPAVATTRLKEPLLVVVIVDFMGNCLSLVIVVVFVCLFYF